MILLRQHAEGAGAAYARRASRLETFDSSLAEFFDVHRSTLACFSSKQEALSCPHASLLCADLRLASWNGEPVDTPTAMVKS